MSIHVIDSLLKRYTKCTFFRSLKLYTFLYFRINYNLVLLLPEILPGKWFISGPGLAASLKVGCFNPRYTWKWPEGFLKILPRHHCKRLWFIWSWALAFFNSPQIIFMCSQDWESQAHAHCSPMPMTHVLPPSNNPSLWKISEINKGPNINYPSPQTFPFFCLSLATSLFFLLKHFTRKQHTLLKASSSERQEIPYLPASG